MLYVAVTDTPLTAHSRRLPVARRADSLRRAGLFIMPNANPYEVIGSPGFYVVQHKETKRNVNREFIDTWDEAVALCDVENAGARRNACMIGLPEADNH